MEQPFIWLLFVHILQLSVNIKFNSFCIAGIHLYIKRPCNAGCSCLDARHLSEYCRKFMAEYIGMVYAGLFYLDFRNVGHEVAVNVAEVHYAGAVAVPLSNIQIVI